MAVTARSNKFRLESGGEARKIDPTMHCFMKQLWIRAGKFARNTSGLQWLTFCLVHSQGVVQKAYFSAFCVALFDASG